MAAGGRTWTLLTNHGAALVFLARSPDATLREVAAAVGITERAASRIVKDLREARFVDATRVGRRNSYTLNLSTPLPHPVGRGRPVEDLIQVLIADLERGEEPMDDLPR